MTDEKKSTVVVLGLGPIGCILAYELHNLGFIVKCYESRNESDMLDYKSHQGYGITCTPSTLSYLHSYDNSTHNIEGKVVEMDGEYIKYDKYGNKLYEDKRADKYCVINRGDIVKRFLAELKHKNINITFDCDLTPDFIKELQNNDSIQNVFDCTGIHSVVRNHFTATNWGLPQYLNILSYYGIIENACVPDFVGKEFQVVDKGGIRMFCKPVTHSQYNWQVFIKQSTFDNHYGENVRLKNDYEIKKFIIAEMEKDGWSENFISLIRNTKENNDDINENNTFKYIRQGRICDRNPIEKEDLKRMRKAGELGKFVMVGDSLHAMTPYRGKGFNIGVQGIIRYISLLKHELTHNNNNNTNDTIRWKDINEKYEYDQIAYATPTQEKCRQDVIDCHF